MRGGRAGSPSSLGGRAPAQEQELVPSYATEPPKGGQARAEQQQRRRLRDDVKRQITGPLNRRPPEVAEGHPADVGIVAGKVGRVQPKDERSAEKSAVRLEGDDDVKVTFGKIGSKAVRLPGNQTRGVADLNAVCKERQVEAGEVGFNTAS